MFQKESKNYSNKLIKKFFVEHKKIVNKFKINFISIRDTLLPLIKVYIIVDSLFKNNSIILKENDIILLALTSIGFLSKENKDTLKILVNEIKKRKLINYYPYVKKSMKSLKNVLNIVFKKDGAVIQNIEQGIKYPYSIDILSILSDYIEIQKINIKDFSYWFISNKTTKKSRDLIDYLHIEYYI